jgi:lipoprotein-anchoring transpeptidase ErfK/SrfK
MVRPVAVVPLLAALVLAIIGLAAATATRAGRTAAKPAATAPLAAPTVAPRPRTLQSLGAVGSRRPAAATPARSARKPPSFELLRLRDGRAMDLRGRPGGRVIATVAARTDFGSPTTLSVAARRGHWVGVPSSALPNGKLGWIDERSPSASRVHASVQLVVNLGRRTLELRSRGRVKRTIRVAVGRPGTSTPTGRFSVTDKLSGSRYGPYYGCCVLALSGHQPHPPPGWQGGDRLAIHGTDAPGTIGTASSAGCLRAADSDLRVLMRRVPLGTPVLIRA